MVACSCTARLLIVIQCSNVCMYVWLKRHTIYRNENVSDGFFTVNVIPRCMEIDVDSSLNPSIYSFPWISLIRRIVYFSFIYCFIILYGVHFPRIIWIFLFIPLWNWFDCANSFKWKGVLFFVTVAVFVIVNCLSSTYVNAYAHCS